MIMMISLWSHRPGKDIFAFIFSKSSLTKSEPEEDDNEGSATWSEGKTGQTQQKTRL